MYQSFSITLDSGNWFSGGLATVHDDGSVFGHVTIYHGTTGSVTVRSVDPDVLRQLGDLFGRASDDVLRAKQDHAQVPA